MPATTQIGTAVDLLTEIRGEPDFWKARTIPHR